jgi:hypothetical protein
MNSVFTLIASLEGNTVQNKTGTPGVFLKNSGWLDASGIEPFAFNY